MADGQALFQTFRRKLKNLRASLLEGCVKDLAAGHRRIVPAFEYGSNDLAFYTGPLDLPEDPFSRLLFLNDRAGPARDFVPIDIKSIELFYKRDDGHMYFTFSLTPNQIEQCQIVLVGSAHDPAYIAFIPTYHIQSDRGRFTSLRLDDRYQLQLIEPFPPEMEPFLLPVKDLRNAFDSLEGHLEGSNRIWTLPHSGIEFGQNIGNGKCSVATIRPSSTRATSLDQMALPIIEAFRSFGSILKARLPGIQPTLGDLLLEDDLKRKTIVLELKSKHCIVKDDVDPNFITLQHSALSMNKERNLIFTFLAPWDCLITTASSGVTLCIPKRDVPLDWWNNPASASNRYLNWQVSRSKFKSYFIDLNDAAQIVRRLEKMYAAGLFAETPHIPMSLLPGLEPSSQQERGTDKGPSSTETDTYEWWMAELLMEMCRHAGEGLVLNLGRRNSMCKFLFVRWRWSIHEKDQYDRSKGPPRSARHFNWRTPALRLKFIQLRWNTREQPTNVGRGLQFKSMKTHPSIAICDTLSWEQARKEHARFIVPSLDFQDEAPYDKILSLGANRDRLFDEYYKDARQVVRSLYEHLISAEVTEDARKYCCSMRDARQAGLDGLAPGKVGSKARGA